VSLEPITLDAWGNPPIPDVPIEDTSPVGPAAGFPSTWQLLDDVQVMELPDPEYLIAGMIPRRGVGTGYGQSGTGKTTWVAQLMTAVATGQPFFGHDVRHRGACVYVATEDVAGFKVRLRSAKRAAGISLDEPIGVYTFPEPIDLRDPASVNRFVRFLEQVELSQRLELIVLDTYAASMPGGSETSSEDTTTAMAHAAQWRDALQATVLMVHHTNASGSRERGHSSMRGACDFMISLTQVDDAIHVESSKQRNGPPFPPFALKLVPLPVRRYRSADR
jgi:RecA-family ATPase